MSDNDAAPYSTSDTELLREMVDNAEARLTAQLTASIAADQRALILSGFLVATIAGLVSGAIALLSGANAVPFLGWVALIASFALSLSLGLAVWAARPVSWSFPGTNPKSWLPDIRSGKPQAARLAERALDCSNKISENAEVTKKNGLFLMWALWISLATAALSAGAVMCHFIGCDACASAEMPAYIAGKS